MATKGGTLICIPCGREVLVTKAGMTVTDLLCCGLAMDPVSSGKAGGTKKVSAGKTVKRKAAAPKAARKKKTPKKAAGRKKAAKQAKKKAAGKKAAGRKKKR